MAILVVSFVRKARTESKAHRSQVLTRSRLLTIIIGFYVGALAMDINMYPNHYRIVNIL
jgi:hypothetical protein